MALVLAGCTPSTTQPAANNVTNETSVATDDANKASVELTVEQLAEFDGKNGNSCYVAVSGVIYDLSDSAFWQNGEHSISMGQASCGRDLTVVFQTQAPRDHTSGGYLQRYPIVGKLV